MEVVVCVDVAPHRITQCHEQEMPFLVAEARNVHRIRRQIESDFVHVWLYKQKKLLGVSQFLWVNFCLQMQNLHDGVP
jgi:hypothetical protein